MGVPTEEIALRTAFRDARPAAIRAGLRNATLLALGTIPLWAGLDWLTRPEHASTFLVLRLAAGVVQLALLRLLLRADGARAVRLAGILGPASASAATNLMAAVTGGLASPYAGGTIIIILCIAILVPWSPGGMLLVGTVVSLVGTTCALLGGIPDTHQMLASLGSFAVATVVAAACAALRDRARWRAFRDGREVAEHARLLEAIHHAQSQFIADADPHVLFGELLDSLVGVTGSSHGFIGEVLPHGDGRPFLQIRALSNGVGTRRGHRALDASEIDGIRFEEPDSLFGAALRTGQPVLAHRPPPGSRHRDPLAGHPGVQAFLGLPLYHGSEMVGLAGIADRAAGYDRALVDRLAPLARTIAGLIVAHRNERERRGVAEAVAEQAIVSAALARVGQALIASVDTPVLLHRLCQVTAEVLDAEASHTLLWQPRDDGFASVAAHGGPVSPNSPTIPREMLQQLFAELEHADVVEVEHQRVDTFVRTSGISPDRPERPPGSRLCLALKRGRTIVGVQIARRNAARGPFPRRALRIAEGAAQLASMALANARLLEELTRASRLKTEFVSTMSHELRTPLNVILGFTDMLRDPAFDADGRAGIVDTIERAGRELLALVESTLEVGRLEAGHQQASLRSTALAPFWRDLTASCAMLSHAPAVTLDWSPAPADATLVTDPQKLAIVLRNLIGNALKFTEEGSVRVDVEATDGHVRFRVADTGIGIAPADHATIFEMFRQADGSDSRRFGGTGLGLYIVRRFVDLLGGDVALESTPGGGSTFTVTLPQRGPSISGRGSGEQDSAPVEPAGVVPRPAEAGAAIVGERVAS